jgi:ABC-2 type transport system ATP-binding protein
LILIENLEKSYGNHKVLDGLSLEVKEGEIYGFIGKNGAGKTTTMNILASMSSFNGGKCVVNGHTILPKSINKANNCGYLPEEPRFYPYMTSYEYLRLLGTIHNDKTEKIKKRSQEMLELVGLTDAKNRIGGFSRGMKQRLGLAAELYKEPEVLLLDEPTSALDPAGRQAVMKILTLLKERGVTIMLSTHILGDIEHLCDRVGFLSGGKTVLEGNLADILNEFAKPGFNIEFTELPSEDEMSIIKELSFVKGIINDEKKLDVFAENPELHFKEFLYLLANFKTPLAGVQLRRATLDDVFEKVTKL